MAVEAGRDFAVVTDPDAGLLTPNVGPPWKSQDGTDQERSYAREWVERFWMPKGPGDRPVVRR